MCWTKSIIRFTLVAGVLLGHAAATFAHSVDGENTASAYRNGGDFTLNSPHGPLSLSDLRGKVVLIFFGYTSCPDICPLALARINAAFSALSKEELERVRALFITLDPERDTPERLAKYMSYFHPKIIGLRDDEQHIKTVTRQYGVTYARKLMPDSALGYSISHPTDILLLDARGQVVEAVPHNVEVGKLLAHIRNLVKGDD